MKKTCLRVATQDPERPGDPAWIDVKITHQAAPR
jgi:hypothetical protein